MNEFLVVLLLLLAAFAAGLIVGKWRRKAAENQGEAAVRRALTKRFSGPSYHLLNNVTLPLSDGTTQIDHVLVSTKGIFVIETKHYTGWIFASRESPKWTQVIYKKKSSFQNPIHQNAKHVRAVQQFLDFVEAQHIHSLVVFTGDAEFKKGRPEGVYDLQGLERHIADLTEDVQSMNRLQFCVGRLETQRLLIASKTDVEHE